MCTQARGVVASFGRRDALWDRDTSFSDASRLARTKYLNNREGNDGPEYPDYDRSRASTEPEIDIAQRGWRLSLSETAAETAT